MTGKKVGQGVERKTEAWRGRSQEEEEEASPLEKD